jgi:hypothetical protein
LQVRVAGKGRGALQELYPPNAFASAVRAPISKIPYVEGMTSSTQHQPLASDTCVHIYTISAAMIGVCLTGVGLIRVVITLKRTNTLADDFLCLDAVLFLFATISAYWALRARGVRRLERLELIADVTFVMGMGLMTGICLFITYAISI